MTVQPIDPILRLYQRNPQNYATLADLISERDAVVAHLDRQQRQIESLVTDQLDVLAQLVTLAHRFDVHCRDLP